jgi:hypothetical protein
MATDSKWDQKVFDRVLDQYLKITSRDTTTAVNTKAFYIARGATRNTFKAGKSRIQAELVKTVEVQRTSKSGKTSVRKTRELVRGSKVDAPLAALIIQSRLKRAGKDGLHGVAMKTAITALINARKRSNAFLASGWLDAIKTLAPLAAPIGKKPAMASASEMKRYGKAKGSATPAVPGPQAVAQIVNTAISKRDDKGALQKFGAPGLSKAFEDEVNSMIDYIMDRMQPAERQANRALR